MFRQILLLLATIMVSYTRASEELNAVAEAEGEESKLWNRIMIEREREAKVPQFAVVV